MGRMFTVAATETAVTTAIDIFEVLADTDAPVLIHGFHLYQTTELGDAAEEVLEIETVRGVGTVTSGSGGNASTEQPIDDNVGTTANAVVEDMNTTRMAVGTGTLEELEKFGWNVRIPWTHYYTPETRPRINPEDRWTLSIDTAPADSVTIGATLWYEVL